MTIKDTLKEYRRGNIVIHDPDKQEIIIKKEASQEGSEK